MALFLFSEKLSLAGSDVVDEWVSELCWLFVLLMSGKTYGAFLTSEYTFLFLCITTDLTQIKLQRILCNPSYTLCASLIVFLGFYTMYIDHCWYPNFVCIFSLHVLIYPICYVHSVSFFYLVTFCVSLYSLKVLLLALLVEGNWLIPWKEFCTGLNRYLCSSSFKCIFYRVMVDRKSRTRIGSACGGFHKV